MARPKKNAPKKRDKYGNVLRAGETIDTRGGKYRYRARWKDEFTGVLHDISNDNLTVLRQKRYELEAAAAAKLELYYQNDRNYFNGKTPVNMPSTLNDLFDLAMIPKKAKIKPGTWSGIRREYDIHIRETSIGRKNPRLITYNDLENFYVYLYREEELRKKTIQHIKYTLSIAFDYALHENWLLKDPLPKVEKTLKNFKEEELPKITLTPKQELRFTEFARNSKTYAKYFYALMIYLDLGCRFGEIVGLTWADVHFEAEKPYIELKNNIQYVKVDGHYKLELRRIKTRAGYRVIVLTEEAAAAFRELRKRDLNHTKPAYELDGVSGFIFTARTGRPWTYRNFNQKIENMVNAFNRQEIKKAAEEQRAPELLPIFRCRTFRRTSATRGHEVLTEEELIARIGHENIKTTKDHYIRHEFEYQYALGLSSAQKLDELRAKNREKYGTG